MQGYDKNDALTFMLKGIRKEEFPEFTETALASLIGEAIDSDLRFMEESGVLEDGGEGDAFYDDDEAFEYITDALCRTRGAHEDAQLAIARLVDAYMDVQQEYLEHKGLISWD